MPIIHIVLFEFKPTIRREVVVDARKRMLALQDNCVHPTSKQPYVKSHGGGRDNSPEGQQVVIKPMSLASLNETDPRSRAPSHMALCLNSNQRRTESTTWNKIRHIWNSWPV